MSFKRRDIHIDDSDDEQREIKRQKYTDLFEKNESSESHDPEMIQDTDEEPPDEHDDLIRLMRMTSESDVQNAEQNIQCDYFIEYRRTGLFALHDAFYESHADGIQFFPSMPAKTPVEKKSKKKNANEKTLEALNTQLNDMCGGGAIETKATKHPEVHALELKRQKEWARNGVFELIARDECPLCDYKMDPPDNGNDEDTNHEVTTFFAYYSSARRGAANDQIFKQMARYWHEYIFTPFHEKGFDVPEINHSIVEYHFIHSPELGTVVKLDTVEQILERALRQLQNNGLYVDDFVGQKPVGNLRPTEKGIKLTVLLAKAYIMVLDRIKAHDVSNRLTTEVDYSEGHFTLSMARRRLASQHKQKTLFPKGNRFAKKIRRFDE